MAKTPNKQAELKRMARYEKAIAKAMWQALEDVNEDIANNVSHDMNKTVPRPEDLDLFLEAYANVETRVKKALGVK